MKLWGYGAAVWASRLLLSLALGDLHDFGARAYWGRGRRTSVLEGSRLLLSGYRSLGNPHQSPPAHLCVRPPCPGLPTAGKRFK